jgi:aldose 1-epimerase
MTVPTDEPTHSCFLTLGAIIQSFTSPDGSNLVLNFPTADLYKQYNEPYFGETIGRVANRISGARINELNGRSYKLAVNNGPNCLHGGQVGWGKKVWSTPREVLRQDGRPAIKFSSISEDGEEGFPGKVAAHVWYMQSRETGPNGEDVNQLEIEYEAELVGQEPGIHETVIGMTNHTYVISFERDICIDDVVDTSTYRAQRR